GMHVEKTHLRDCLWANVVIFVVLRTSFETATAGHATRVSVPLHHVFLVHPWSWSKIVRAVEFDPGVNSLQVIEHLRTIDYQIANVRKLCHRFEFDRLVEIVDQSRARLPHASVDDHRANAANLFETIHVP